MKKAKLALVAVMPYIFIHAAAHAAVDTNSVTLGSVAQDAITDTESVGDSDVPANDPIAKLTELALGGMSDLGGILTSDLPSPESRAASFSEGSRGLVDKVAIGASDAAPSWDQPVHSESIKSGQGSSGPGMGAPRMGPPGMCKMGFGMRGCVPMGRHHFRCPWEKLEGANALTDEQYQKLYDIKGQFIASIVPKGLNVWMLARKMKDLLEVGNVDTNAVKDVEKQIAAATSDLSMTAMDSIVLANQVLTPEQRKELHKMSIRSTLGGSGHHQDKESHPAK